MEIPEASLTHTPTHAPSWKSRSAFVHTEAVCPLPHFVPSSPDEFFLIVLQGAALGVGVAGPKG